MTAGERFATAGNELVQGLNQIQFIVNRPAPMAEGVQREEYLLNERSKILKICEQLVGPYKIIIADLTR